MNAVVDARMRVGCGCVGAQGLAPLRCAICQISSSLLLTSGFLDEMRSLMNSIDITCEAQLDSPQSP